ncbi:hypothetical protein CDD81_4017 [Ophiocordyceps australis]|uniref:Uncharacterized protein n=1 Tax=Ophiocordyceps australis TaxID=1399860 RepID=A0A2C5Y5J0_9HYPO|nr:hypothetical protein CDD81_4017 [Ophiocordyceps australis]
MATMLSNLTSQSDFSLPTNMTTNVQGQQCQSEVVTKARRPKVSMNMLDTLSDWPIRDAGVASPGIEADHEVVYGTKKNPGLRCCELAYSSAIVRKCTNGSYVAKFCYFSTLTYPEYSHKYNRSVLYLAGKAVHEFDCFVFVKDIPEGSNDTCAKWKFAFGYLPIFDVDENWRKEYLWMLPVQTVRRSSTWNLFWKWLEQFDEQESKERYIKLALLSLAQLQYKKRDPDNRPFRYQARLVVTFHSDNNFAYLYQANFFWKDISLLQRTGQPDPDSLWPEVQCRKIPFNPTHGFADLLIEELQPMKAPRANKPRNPWPWSGEASKTSE